MLVLKNRIFNKKIVAVVLLGISIISCSSSDEDPKDVVAELSELENKFDVEVIWEESVGYGVEDHFSRIKPAVAYGKVYSASRDGDLIAFDQATGDEVWAVDLSDIHDELGFFDTKKSAQLSGGVLAGMKKVFIGNENGNLYALDAETGELAWEASVKGEIINTPAIESGILVVNSASGILQAFNASSGEELWKVEQDVPALTLRGMSPPVIASGGVLVGNSTGVVSVYLLEKGQAGWSAEIGEASGNTELERVIDVDSAPLAFGDKIYAVSSRGNLAAIELRSGNILWKRQYSSYREISLNRNSIYLTTDRGHVYSVNRNEGLEQWNNLELNNRGVTGPAVFGPYIVVGDFDGYLHFIDQDSGEIVARHHVDGSGIYGTPVVVDDVLYTQSRDGDLQAIKLPEITE